MALMASKRMAGVPANRQTLNDEELVILKLILFLMLITVFFSWEYKKISQFV